jgi:hypothetical protein
MQEPLERAALPLPLRGALEASEEEAERGACEMGAKERLARISLTGALDPFRARDRTSFSGRSGPFPTLEYPPTSKMDAVDGMIENVQLWAVQVGTLNSTA